MTTEVITEPTAQELAGVAAERFIAAAHRAIDDHGMFRVALSGGNTPRALYEKLAVESSKSEIWDCVQVFFSDERFVPPDSTESNFHLAKTTLLSRVPIPERFVYRVATVEIPPEAAAKAYEDELRRVFAVRMPDVPRFDLILLGLGEDGHTASLFPDTEALRVQDRLVVANFVSKLNTWRVTFTYPLINAAEHVIFLVQGEGKAEMVRRVVDGAPDLPASGVHPDSGTLTWLLDQAAASRLPETRQTV
ncbi:MAG: 6-phosphogluconolactonase [Chloroflexota bacterium]